MESASSPMRSLVIGGTGGLGRAIAARLASRGDWVGVLGRDRERMKGVRALIEEAGGTCRRLFADVLDPGELAAAFSDFVGWAGGLDCLVFAAGRFRSVGPLVQADPGEWTLDLRTSLVGVLNTVQAAAGPLARSDRASLSILVGPGSQGPLPNGSAFSTAQAGLVRLVETLACRASVPRPRGLSRHRPERPHEFPPRIVRREEVAAVVHRGVRGREGGRSRGGGRDGGLALGEASEGVERTGDDRADDPVDPRNPARADRPGGSP